METAFERTNEITKKIALKIQLNAREMGADGFCWKTYKSRCTVWKLVCICMIALIYVLSTYPPN